ncbi:MAG: hypothetical protein NZ825_10655 [Candidatus Marinimicrobia bacterium]|nr:hypothetical protein [Candidatus Neomarinimicrobiota bacterium]
MKVYELITKQTNNKPIPEVFSFFSRPENLAVITPKKLDFRILTPSPINMEKGTVIDNLFSSEKYKLYTSDTNQGAVA